MLVFLGKSERQGANLELSTFPVLQKQDVDIFMFGDLLGRAILPLQYIWQGGLSNHRDTGGTFEMVA